jgi:cytochrome P450
MTAPVQDDLPRGIALTSLSPEFRDDPHAILNAARLRCPVLHDGILRDYVVLSADLARKVLADRSLPSDPRKTVASSTRRLRGEDLTRDPPIMFMDDPLHKRVRGLVGRAFNAERIERARPRVAALCRRLIDAADPAGFDFVEAIARPLPTIAIADLLGINSRHHDDFKRWSDQMVVAMLNPLAPPDVKALGVEAAAQLYGLFTAEIAARRAATAERDDLITALMTVEHQGERLDDAEIAEHAQVLLIAGNQTTTDLLGTMLCNILKDRENWPRLVADQTLVANAVDEAIRFEPPIFSTDRIAPEDMELGGVAIPKGEQISVMLTAVNHDPALNPDPDRFDIARKPVKYFSFGGGRHTCLGAPLARLEAQELLRALIDRFPVLVADPAHPAIYTSNPGFRGLESFRVMPA